MSWLRVFSAVLAALVVVAAVGVGVAILVDGNGGQERCCAKSAEVARNAGLARSVTLLGCPVKRLTGIPCPSCGATRAFVLLAQRDPAWRDYNTICVGYATASIVASFALPLLPASSQAMIVHRAEALVERLREKPALALACAILIALPPWLLALRRPAIRRASG